MSLTPPPPLNSGSYSANVAGFPAQLSPYPNVQPFSYPDGLTFQKLFESYRHWLLTELVPHIDSIGSNVVDAYNEASATLAKAMDDYADEIGSDRAAYVATIAADREAFNATANQIAAGATASANAAAASATTATQKATSAANFAQVAQTWASKTTNQRARLATRAASDAALSSGYSRIATDDATQVVENWSDLAGWVGTGGQVSASALFGSATPTAGLSKLNSRVAPGSISRSVAVVKGIGTSTVPSGAGILFGFNKSAVNAAPSNGGANARGIYIRYDTGGSIAINSLDNGTQANLASIPARDNETFTATATVDETYLSVTVIAQSDGTEAHARWLRDDAAFPLNNLTLMVNDSRQLTGSSVTTVSTRVGGLVTAKPKAITARTAHWGSSNGDGFVIELPASYDSRKPTPAIIFFHGNGSDESIWLTNFNSKAVFNAVVNAGFIAISAANTGATSTWGSDDGLNAYVNAYRYAITHYNISGVGFYANSMGGIESLLTLAREDIPGVVAWAGTVPTYSLEENYNNVQFTSTIEAAYGGNYAANSVGHDPSKLDPSAFRNIPMWMLVATDDAAVTPGPNGQALYAALNGAVPITKIEATGGHSSGAIATNAPVIASWFKTQFGII